MREREKSSKIKVNDSSGACTLVVVVVPVAVGSPTGRIIRPARGLPDNVCTCFDSQKNEKR